ncbi:MAG: thiamine-phosphate kinase [Acidobacteriota bacterium]
MSTQHRLDSEDQLIRRIQRWTSGLRKPRSLHESIGDDAAVFEGRKGHLTLLSTDALVQGVHFDLRYTGPADLGWKALAVNLSDIAAMGGTARYFTTSICVPKTLPPDFLDAFYRGMARLAKQHQVHLVGGDTCASRRDLFIDVAITGEVKASELLTRSGARPGDWLFVSGELGGSAMGLELLRRRQTIPSRCRKLVRRHLRPEPRLQVGRYLARRRLASAMIDLSDGLSTDLHRLCQRSQVGALIESSQIPIPSILPKLLSKPVLSYALHGGEDYELLFAVPPQLGSRVPRRIFGIPVRRVGQITGQRGKVLLSAGNHAVLVASEGFDHFRKTGRGSSETAPLSL